MRILHIGDFHFKSRNESDHKEIVDKMVESLKEQPPIDFVFFTGDLVYSGKNFKDFLTSYEIIFATITNQLSVGKENIFFSCGNHDISQDDCSEMVLSFFDNKSQIKENKDIDSFYAAKSKEFLLSIEPLKNVNQFIKEKFIYIH